MITAAIKENEIVNGYLGRLMTLNLAHNKADFLADLQKHYIDESPDASVISLLAHTSNKSVLEILKSNTIVPYRRAATQSKAFDAQEFLKPNVSDASCFRTIRPGMVLCEDCIRSDIEEFNFPYWKTFHQLPGVDWCPTHNTPLRIAKKKYHDIAYETGPNAIMNKSVLICEYDESLPTPNEATYRYIQLVSLFLKIRTPVRARDIVSKLGAKAREKHNIHTNRVYHSKRTTLADLAKSSCTYSWLKRLFPRIDYPDQYGWIGAIDNSTRVIATAESFALALALLFDSTNEAVDFMINDLKINVELTPS